MHLSDNAVGVHYFKLIDLQNKRTNVSNLRIKEFFQVSSTEVENKEKAGKKNYCPHAIFFSVDDILEFLIFVKQTII